ncbi:ferritin-like domain-containing protein [Actinopolymorpha alba]|uniref:ferritin-like domain-containing protein n=1 Tax=Actinopolymorpha alba TaxID=533267 RepID=UPI0003672F88|nr:ferritin-like domain-containing protein [Actinopolymorpha alba]
MTNQREIETLQQALAGVHAAIWGYAVLGPRLRNADRERGRQVYSGYRGLRDQLTSLIRARRTTPVAAEPAYALPFQVTSATTARRLAAHLEDGCAGVFADLVAGAATADVRVFAARLLNECAERRLQWGSDPVAFPGLAKDEAMAAPRRSPSPTPANGTR